MELIVDRAWKKDKYTIGKFFINGKRFCESLEDTDRGLDSAMPMGEILSKKKYGITAIPTGTYEIKLTYSAKFNSKSWAKKYGGFLPEVMNVPGYSGIRIHPGSTANDTLGCILLGKNTKKGMVTSSQDTFHAFMGTYLIPALEKGERVTITIK